jgi:hypothetical protein
MPARSNVRHKACETMIAMKMIFALTAAFVALPLASCEKARTGDTAFARDTFISLAKGESSVQAKIDWQTLTALGDNVGAKYNLIPTETEKQEFRTAFVTGFSSSFRDGGGSVDAFTNWRVTFNDSTRTEVAADSPGGLLRLTVSERDSLERISSIDIVK